jgi:hypothetical protein
MYMMCVRYRLKPPQFEVGLRFALAGIVSGFSPRVLIQPFDAAP